MKQKINKLFSVLVLIALFMQVNQIGVYYLLFEFNQNKIANTVCEKVVVHCDGKCFLKKQIAKTSDEDSKQTKSTAPIKTKTIELIGSDYISKEILSQNSTNITGSNFQIKNSSILFTGFYNSVDPPPKA